MGIADLKKALQKLVSKWMEVEKEQAKAKQQEKPKPRVKSEFTVSGPTFRPPTVQKGNVNAKRKISPDLTDIKTSIQKKRRLEDSKEKNSSDNQSEQQIRAFVSVAQNKSVMKVVTVKKDDRCQYCDQKVCDCSEEMDFSTGLPLRSSTGDSSSRSRTKEMKVNQPMKTVFLGGANPKGQQNQPQTFKSKPFNSNRSNNRAH